LKLVIRQPWRVAADRDKMIGETTNARNGRLVMAKGSSNDPFKQREIALEEAFFKERDRQLLEKLRGELSAKEEKRKVGHVTGIVEEHVLDSLVKAGVQAETLTAVALIPLVEVAWCDGTVAPEEREAVLNAAVAHGIHPDSAAYALLKRWLEDQPDPGIIGAWKEYVHELARVTPKETIAAMKKNMLDRAHRVAAAAGGFLGLATISKHEHAKIDELAKAWDA
jgi:hypothetical protein